MESRAAVSRLDGIDGLRGIAIALVVAYHTWLVYGAHFSLGVLGLSFSYDALAKTGFLGVELFFALSGFCMFYPYAQARFRGTPPPTWGSYAYRRAIKIVPSYVVALTAFAIIDPSGGPVPGGVALAYATHLTFVHPFFPQQFQSISAPLWTIGVEVQFYLIFPLLCARFLQRPALAAAGVAALAAGYRLVLHLTNHDVDFFWTSQVVAFLDIFAAGMLAAYLVAWFRSRPMDADATRTATILSAAAGTIALYGLVVLSQSPAMNGGPDFFIILSGWRLPIAALLFALVATTTLALPQWRRVVANPLFTFLAVVSYNLYLWHLEVLVLSQRANLALPVAVLASVAIASAVTYFLERPLLQLKLDAAKRAARLVTSSDTGAGRLTHLLRRATRNARDASKRGGDDVSMPSRFATALVGVRRRRRRSYERRGFRARRGARLAALADPPARRLDHGRHRRRRAPRNGRIPRDARAAPVHDRP
jgi:peptidoglycan/LPS O-acetylase OafA/YrhL